ncbi:ATP-binding protein [Hymenobacter siberiensis]|uniref:ATP-binding protein n=1 Tax=Hymenobacter siberiensis TaxID=2848396 RepID=UPI00293D667C|nr:ATP-binding protein [Hymenobacter siberiensis]
MSSFPPRPPARRCWLPLVFLLLLSGPLAAQSSRRYWEADPDSLRRVLATQRTDTARLRTLMHLVDTGEGNIAHLAELSALSGRLHRPEHRAYRLLLHGKQLAARRAVVPALDSLQAAIAALDRLHRPVPWQLISIRFLFNAAGQPQAKRAYYESQLATYRRRGDAVSMTACYHGLAGYYNSLGNYNQAIGYYLQAAEGYRAFSRGTSRDEFAAAGQLYAEWGNLDKALYYLRQSLAGQGNPDDSYRNLQMAAVQLQVHNYPAALHAIDRALAAAARDTTNDATLKPIALVLKSAVLLAQRRPREAGPLLRTAQYLADSLQLPFRSGYGTLELEATWARYYEALGDNARAESYWLAASRTVRQGGFASGRLAYLHELARFYQQHRRPAVAATYALAALGLADTLRAAEGALNVTRYETDQAQQTQQARIAGLRLAQVQDAARARRQRLLLGAALAVLALLAGLGFVLWRGNRRQQQANAQLEAQRDETAQALKNLQTTQTQLIQAEKMASLGELTAGIAHEIQNPLNFVNNFAEVSAELLTELKEAQAAGDFEEVMALADDLTQNLVKINQHGQRAAGIVRGMLEHSRASTGERAPTDLNQLADEYLRLAYHGLRAKDKTFNATLETDFAPALPLVDAVSGDLGRVLLNLFTNAFYAVRQRQQAGEAGYAPTVGVGTARANGHVEIRVTDNGSGMPPEVQQKIFQPFFTTKPTGEGTGLGLSLSHDIVVQGHGGTLTVESQPGQGTTFTISLPA